jgi:hypothetical protein
VNNVGFGGVFGKGDGFGSLIPATMPSLRFGSVRTAPVVPKALLRSNADAFPPRFGRGVGKWRESVVLRFHGDEFWLATTHIEHLFSRLASNILHLSR